MSHKAAFALARRLREALSAGRREAVPGGHAEVDGAYLGGRVRQENRKADRGDRRPSADRGGFDGRSWSPRASAAGARRRPWCGRGTRPWRPSPAGPGRAAEGGTLHADEASRWDGLHARFDAERINHGFASSDDGACTNQAESFFSRLRRAEPGQHPHISGPHLGLYAGETAWREDARRGDRGALAELAGAAALGHPESQHWSGCRRRADRAPGSRRAATGRP